MRPYPKPEPAKPVPVDRARVRELVEQLHAAASRGESIHAHPAVYAIDALIGGSICPGYYVVAELGLSEPPLPVEVMVDHIVKHAERWAEDARRVKDPKL